MFIVRLHEGILADEQAGENFVFKQGEQVGEVLAGGDAAGVDFGQALIGEFDAEKTLVYKGLKARQKCDGRRGREQGRLSIRPRPGERMTEQPQASGGPAAAR